MAYVYQHIRLDTNEVFYVGIGSDDTFYRANLKCKKCRTEHWHNIVKKYGYKIEIFAHDISWEEACEIEKSLIKSIGRRIDGSGSLVNMTEGGEGIPGFKHSKESILKTINSEGFKNRKKSQDHTKGKTYEEIYGKEKAEQVKIKQSKAIRPPARTGKDHHLFGKKRPEHSAKLKGRPNEKLKGLLVGDKNPMRNKEVALKLSRAKLGIPRNKLTCPHCGKIGGDGNMQRWHFDNCKTLHN